MTSLNEAIERKDWELAAVLLLLGLSRVLARLPRGMTTCSLNWRATMARRRESEPATAGVDPARALTLYQGVRQEADDAVREAVPTDLSGELTLLRRLLREQIEKDPDGLELTIKAMHLLVRMVTAQHKLTNREAAQLSEEAKRVLDQFSHTIMGLEASDDEKLDRSLEDLTAVGRVVAQRQKRHTAAAVTEERVRSLEAEVSDLKGRVNSLLFVLIGAVATQVILRIFG